MNGPSPMGSYIKRPVDGAGNFLFENWCQLENERTKYCSRGCCNNATLFWVVDLTPSCTYICVFMIHIYFVCITSCLFHS